MSDTPPDGSTQILEKLDYLKDLFERRLVEDRAKNRAFEELYQQVEFAQKGLTEQFLLPIVSELLLICDRVERDATTADRLARSASAELIEVLARRGLSEIDEAATFDPGCHRAVEAIDTDDATLNGEICSFVRTGYRLGDRLVRPAEVTVYRHSIGPRENEESALE